VSRGGATRAGDEAPSPDGAAVPTRIDRGVAVLGLVTVLLANIRYLTGVRDVVDPGVSMDPYYIHMAAQPIGAILRGPPAWGPLYGLWLKPFVALLGDPLAVFTANLCALSLALSTAIYVHLLLLTRRPAVGVAVALLFLISDANVPLAGKVSGFALLVMLCGWSVAALVPAGARRTSVAAAAVLLASYARPELYPAAIVLWLVALWQARAGEGWSAAIWPGVALTVPSRSPPRSACRCSVHRAATVACSTPFASTFPATGACGTASGDTTRRFGSRSLATPIACWPRSAPIPSSSRTTSPTISSTPSARCSRMRFATTRCSPLPRMRAASPSRDG
jgi:hypothetical protein